MVPQPFCNSATDQSPAVFLENIPPNWRMPRLFQNVRFKVGRSERNTKPSCIFLHLPGLRETMIWLKGCWMFFRWIMDYSMFFFCAEGFLWLGMSGNSAWIASIHSKFLNTAYMTLLKFAKQNQTRSTTNNRINGENHKKALFQLNLWWAFLDLILSSTNVGGLSCPVLTGLRWFLPLLHPTPGAVKVARYERWFKKGSKRGPPPFHIYV